MRMPNRPLCGTSAEPCGTSLQVIENQRIQATYPQTYPHFAYFVKHLITHHILVERLVLMKMMVRNLAEPLAKSLISLCGTSSAEPAEPPAKSLILLCGTSAEPSPPPKGGDRDPHRVGGSLSRNARFGRSLRRLRLEGVA